MPGFQTIIFFEYFANWRLQTLYELSDHYHSAFVRIWLFTKACEVCFEVFWKLSFVDRLNPLLLYIKTDLGLEQKKNW